MRPRRLRTAITAMTCSCPHGICRSLACVHQPPKITFPWGLTDFQSLFCLFTTAKHLFFIFNHEFSDCNNLRSCSWCPPTNSVIESLGLRLLGTHLGPPRQTASDSRMMAVSNALLSSPWLCSEQGIEEAFRIHDTDAMWITVLDGVDDNGSCFPRGF